MRRIFLSLITLAATAAASAVVVENIAGQLEANTTDRNITELTVTGTIDARDVKFIADSLAELRHLDLSEAQVMAYCDSLKPLAGTIFNFPANEFPAALLMGAELETIVMPQTITSIGHAALAGCEGITSIVVPDSVTTIGSYAFSGTGLTSVVLPQAVTTVGEGAWARCMSLESATINLDEVPAHAFMGDTLLSDVTLGEKVTTLGKSAFNGCSALDSVKVAEGNAITTIGTEAFIGAGAQAIDLSTLTRLERVGNWAFATTGITSAALPASVSTLGDGAFFYSPQVGSAVIPEGMTRIPAYAFTGDSLVSVFTVPASVSYIGGWAMAGMTGLDTINAPAVVPELGDSVWARVPQSLVMLHTANNDIADLYAAAEQWKEFHILRDYLMGDANNDGNIDVIDVNMMIAVILGQSVSGFYFELADINGNGEIEVIDINLYINYILNGNYDYIRKAPGRNQPASNFTSDCIEAMPLAINAGETRQLTLVLNNERDYSSLQCDITMPEGLAIVPGSMQVGQRNAGHTIIMSDNCKRMMCYSNAVKAIDGREGTIVTLQVTADDTFAGNGEIAIGNLILATPQHERYVGSDSYSQVSNTSGIDDVDTNANRVYAYGRTLVIETENAGSAVVAAMNGASQEINVQAGRNEIDMPTGFYVVSLAGKGYKVVIK